MAGTGCFPQPPHLMASPSQCHHGASWTFPKSLTRCSQLPVGVAGVGGVGAQGGHFLLGLLLFRALRPLGCPCSLSLWLLLVWPPCHFNFSNSLERVIFHNSAHSEALCLPALPSHTCCWHAPAAHACTCPASPACPSLLHTKASHAAPVPPWHISCWHSRIPSCHTSGAGAMAW